MHVRYSLLASQATTALFVLLWGSAAIFTRWGLDNASPMALLVFRFLVALVALAPLAIVRRRWLPAPGTRLQTAATGLMLIGGYSVCYFEAMANGVTPGLIATIMGIQPILTLCVVERRLQGRRLSGLLLALAGLVLLVWRSLAASPMATVGILFALAALLLGMSLHDAGVLALTLLLGTPTLSFLGAVGVGLTVGLKRGGVLLSLLVLPLAVPLLIFATAACQAAAAGLPVGGYLAMLAAFLTASATLCPFATAAALRLTVR